jgi:hypothetical protein
MLSIFIFSITNMQLNGFSQVIFRIQSHPSESATTRVFAKQQLEAPCLWLAPMGMDIFCPLLA